MRLSLDIKRFSNEIEEILSTIKTKLINLVCEEADFFNLETETQRIINEGGAQVLKSILSQYDIQTDAVEYKQCRFNRAGRYSKKYQTVFGKVDIERTIYRDLTSRTEKSICPLEIRAGILDGYWTPKSAKIGSLVMTEVPSRTSAMIINEALQINVCSSSLDRLMKGMGEIWEKSREKFDRKIVEKITIPKQAASLVISLDGVLIPTRCTRVLPSDSRFEEASCGTLSFLDDDGNKLSTLFYSRSPEKKKLTLKAQLKQAFDHVIQANPKLTVVKLADASRDNWSFLEEDIKGEWELIDFYHAAEHLKEGVDDFYGKSHVNSSTEFKLYRHKLRHNKTGANQVLAYLKKLLEKKPRSTTLADQVTYFTRNKHRMKYAQAKMAGLAIGSGIVEAACKTVVAERLKRSGMQWDYEGAQSILSLRTASRSGQFDTSFDMIRGEVNRKVIPLRKIKRNYYEEITQNIAA